MSLCARMEDYRKKHTRCFSFTTALTQEDKAGRTPGNQPMRQFPAEAKQKKDDCATRFLFGFLFQTESRSSEAAAQSDGRANKTDGGENNQAKVRGSRSENGK